MDGIMRWKLIERYLVDSPFKGVLPILNTSRPRQENLPAPCGGHLTGPGRVKSPSIMNHEAAQVRPYFGYDAPMRSHVDLKLLARRRIRLAGEGGGVANVHYRGSPFAARMKRVTGSSIISTVGYHSLGWSASE